MVSCWDAVIYQCATEINSCNHIGARGSEHSTFIPLRVLTRMYICYSLDTIVLKEY